MNEELKRLFDEDQAERLSTSNSDSETWKQIADRDEVRRERAKRLIEEHALTAAEDFYHAGFIFQHGGGAEDYLSANELAKKAMDMGYEPAKWLFAASWDRYLLKIGKSQKYGTQYITKGVDDDWVLRKVDPSTTDEERAKYNIRPLSEIPKTKPRR